MLSSAKSQAEPLNVTLAELGTAIDSLASEPDALQRLVLQKIQSELSAANLSFSAGELLYTDISSDLTSDSSCNRTEVRELTTNVTLNADTGVVLSLVSINDPIKLAINLDARLNAVGQARQVFGFRFRGCRSVGSDSFSFTASSDVQLSLQLDLRLNPNLDTENRQLTLRPAITLTGMLSRQGIHTDVEDSLLRNVLERILEDEIKKALDQSDVLRAVARLERNLIQRLDTHLDNGVLSVKLPDPSDEQIRQLYHLLSPQGDFSLSLGYLRTQRLELLAALILGDDKGWEAIFSDAAMCEAAGLLQVPLAHHALYAFGEDGCSAVQIPPVALADESGQARQQIDDTTWFVDSACQTAVDFQTTSTPEFCATFLDTERLGNAASNVDELGRWTLSPGTRFDIGAVSLVGQLQPFTQRVKYKSVTTDMGECELEMRVHSPVPFDQDDANEASRRALRPLIALHGGSWQHRTSGGLGLEAFATSLMNQGFVVFEPFYRLIGDSAGNMECNNATLDELMADTDDAMSWVLQNAYRYGAMGKPVLFGHSAGGHLAGVLAVERAAEVAAAVLFYAPVDFTDFARQLINGEIDTQTGQNILEAVVGQTLETLDLQEPSQAALFQRNTLPARIAVEAMSGPVPPFFLLHGRSDSLLPYRQSVRLCNVLAGRAIDTEPPASEPGSELRQILDCGDGGSQLHLITQGEHALDLCVADELCLAGSPASAALTRDSIEQMLDWITRVGVVQDDDGNGGSGTADIIAGLAGDAKDNSDDGSFSKSGAGAVSFDQLLWLFVLTGLAGLRRRKPSTTT